MILTQLTPSCPTVGPITGPLACDRPDDDTTLTDIARAHSLVALNTWRGLLNKVMPLLSETMRFTAPLSGWSKQAWQSTPLPADSEPTIAR